MPVPLQTKLLQMSNAECFRAIRVRTILDFSQNSHDVEEGSFH